MLSMLLLMFSSFFPPALRKKVLCCWRDSFIMSKAEWFCFRGEATRMQDSLRLAVLLLELPHIGHRSRPSLFFCFIYGGRAPSFSGRLCCGVVDQGAFCSSRYLSVFSMRYLSGLFFSMQVELSPSSCPISIPRTASCSLSFHVTSGMN